ncbi:microtubule-associated tumor suppressor candidate 2 [Lissotriton helveticus]
MAAPVIPNKASFRELHDNMNDSQNDNESLLGLGDTNANQIMTSDKIPEEEGKRSDEVEKVRSLSQVGCENLVWSGKQQRKCLSWLQDSQVSGVISKEPKRYSPTIRRINEEFMSRDHKDNLRHIPISHGKTERTPTPIESCTEEVKCCDKETSFTTFETERLSHVSYGGSIHPSGGPETVPKEAFGHPSHIDLRSVSPAFTDTSCDRTGATPKSPKTPTDQFLGLTFHPLDNTSEENKTVLYTKTSTSESRKLPVSELRMDSVKLQNSSRQSTFHPTYSDQHLNPISKTQEICNLSEAQGSQTDKSRRLGLPQHKSSWQSRAESIMLVEMAACQRDGSVRGKQQCGTDVAESSPSQMQDIFSEVDNFRVKQAEAGSDVRPTCGSTAALLAEESRDNVNWPVSQANQDHITTSKEHRPTCPSSEPNRQDSGMMLTNRNRLFDENAVACSAVGRDSNLFVHNVNPPGSVTFRESENITPLKGKPDSASIKAFEFSDYQRFWSQETASTECPSYRDRNNDSHVQASSNKINSEEPGLATRNKTAATVETQISDGSKGSYKASTSTDGILTVPCPLYPVTRVNISKQTSTLRNLYALHVDRLSPSTVLPPIDSTQLLNISPQGASTAVCNSGIPKTLLVHSKPSLSSNVESSHREMAEEKGEAQPVLPKPKHVRPKIITYIRRSPQPVDRLDTSFEPSISSTGPQTSPASSLTDHRTFTSDVKAPNLLYDKFKPDVQKPRIYASGLMVSGIKPPGHQFGQMSEQYVQEVAERPGKEDFCSPPYSHYDVTSGFYRPAMLLKPQLGLGAVSRLPSAKSRILIASQRSPTGTLHQQGQVASTENLFNPDTSVDLKKGNLHNAIKANHPKPCQSGLRPPGYSRLPTAKMPAFGFVRTSSVSSVSSNHSNDSVQGDNTKAIKGSAVANEEQSTPKAAAPSKEVPKGANRTVQQVPNGVSNLRRSFLPAPKAAATPPDKVTFSAPGSPRRNSPISGAKKVQKDQEPKPALSSPKRSVTSASSVYSPAHSKPRPGIPRNGFNPRPEADRQLVQRLKEKCQEQSRQLLCVQEELKRASRGFEVFAVATQHFFKKNERGLKKEKELSIELANIRDEVAVNTAKCEKLQKEKEELERRFEDEVRKLQAQQQSELRALEERLQLQYQTEIERLQQDHTTEFTRTKSLHQEQIDDMVVSQDATVLQLENHHTEAIAVLRDEHNYQVEELKCNHELEKKTLEDNFENMRLSLQDQVDTLTFQSHSLRDRAKRFEEALRKSTDEQFQDALAPFQHLEEDLSSLKQVLEMKNQQIHEQEKKIMELEKLVDINVRLEERIQVLQQQNEDLKVRIDQNVAVTRHLSEENANLHESVEKESEEKKRLSRTNEELIWKLQTGEPMSPVRLSPSSTLYHSVSGSLSPSQVHAAPR